MKEAVPPRLRSFRCPKQQLATLPLQFLVCALNLQSNTECVDRAASIPCQQQLWQPARPLLGSLSLLGLLTAVQTETQHLSCSFFFFLIEISQDKSKGMAHVKQSSTVKISLQLFCSGHWKIYSTSQGIWLPTAIQSLKTSSKFSVEISGLSSSIAPV